MFLSNEQIDRLIDIKKKDGSSLDKIDEYVEFVKDMKITIPFFSNMTKPEFIQKIKT